MKIKKIVGKIINVLMCLLLTTYTLFGSLLQAKAEAGFIGKVTSDGIRVRSTPTTAEGLGNVITVVDYGVLINVLDKNTIKGAGCDKGWYHISYGSVNGYICSAYVTSDLSDAIDRPWTTPKKAIVGGAKFISKSYISKGQYTSYLKKFNVNPNSSYEIYTHQYMASLFAPATEASISYNTYKANNLLDLPLQFDIPIYNNMGEKNDRPGGNPSGEKYQIPIQDEVTDQNFENYLDSQGFDNSYKRILRALHTAHPNWVFNSIRTNLDFNTAVSEEKTKCSIQGNNAWYDQPVYETEPGWYRANNATVAYYLDPRNFLTETYILMFESLKNSSNYNETVVQNVLTGTFMAGNSELDKQSYASIFVEAAKTADVSAVYLASLARAESGVNGGITTSGAEFTYKDIKYSGVFNFFNIGAYSSEANPAKAGLVYATGGYCTICSPSSTAPTPTISNDVSTAIANIGAISKGNYLTNIGPSVAASTLQSKEGGIVFDTPKIGTGTIATFKDGTKYTVIVYGDSTGDGEINSADLLKLRQHLLGTNKLSGAYFEAASISGDNEVNSADLLKLRQYLLGQTTISQK